MALAPTDFRWDGGAHWLDLLATRGHAFGEEPIERLPDGARLGRWLEEGGLAPGGPPPTDADAARVRELRDALRRLATARVDGAAPGAGDLRLANDWASRAGATTLEASWQPRRAASLDELLARLARQAIEAMSGREAQFLRTCEDAECRMVYLDTSGRRRWCPSGICGNRARVRAHRARKRAGG